MNLWTNLLFAHGHIANAELALSLSKTSTSDPAAATASATRQIEAVRRKPASQPRRAASIGLLGSLSLLGGRPMTAGHNDDIDEPFDVRPARRAATSGCGPGQLHAGTC